MCNNLNIGELEFVKVKSNGWKGWVAADCADAFSDIDGWLVADGRKIVRRKKNDGSGNYVT